jgi:hypothetical protein
MIRALSYIVIVGGIIAGLVACGVASSQWPQATRSDFDILAEAQQIREDEQFSVLSRAREIEMQFTATAEAARATTTAEAYRVWAEQAKAEATATAVAAQIRATATAEANYIRATATTEAVRATATAEAVLFAQQATVTAQQWMERATATAEAQRLNAIATTSAIYAQSTATAVEVRKRELQLEREENMNQVRAMIPYAIIILSAGVILWGAVRLIMAVELRVRAIPRDERGDAPVMMLSFRGATYAYDPDRGFGPVTMFTGEGAAQPAMAREEIQERVTARDQTVDLVHRGFEGQGGRRRRVTAQQAGELMAQPALPGPVHVVPPEQVGRWLKDVEPQAMAQLVEGEVLND